MAFCLRFCRSSVCIISCAFVEFSRGGVFFTSFRRRGFGRDPLLQFTFDGEMQPGSVHRISLSVPSFGGVPILRCVFLGMSGPYQLFHIRYTSIALFRSFPAICCSVFSRYFILGYFSRGSFSVQVYIYWSPLSLSAPILLPRGCFRAATLSTRSFCWLRVSGHTLVKA